MSIISPDINKNMDGSVLRIAQHINSPIPIVPITRIEGFKFNDGLLALDKYILLDYSELWWNTENTDTHLFGKNTGDFPEIFKGDDWRRFDDFVRDNPPLLTLKRELLKKDISENILPIDYPMWTNPYPIESHDDFLSRPINCFSYWGRSNENRVKLHADFWLNSSHNGASICDNLFYLELFLREEQNNNKWVTLNVPHYVRQPIENILAINGLSKLSVSMNGSGRKCFRHAESPANSIMVTEENELAWQFDWVHGDNCIKFDKGKEIETIELALTMSNLYEIYCSGVENANKYHHENYFQHIRSIINKFV
jgi:hypothetical protein